MSKLIRGTLGRGGQRVDDRWVTIECGAQVAGLASHQGALVPWRLWPALSAELVASGRDLGVLLEPSDDPFALAPELARLSLIAIDFPTFVDGRGYSSARLVRERLGYRGELRAVGDILRDQVFYLLRCGFDSLLLREDQDVDAALAAFGDFIEVYQRAVDRPVPLFARRGAALAALAAKDRP